MDQLKACIFDLDGVVVDTAKYHFYAWQRLAGDLGFEFTKADNERLKGISRKQSLEIVLEVGGIERSEAEKDRMCDLKNRWFNEYVDKMTPAEILPGVISLFDKLKSEGILIALGSASKNAPKILDKLALTKYFDAVVDGGQVKEAKPHPAIFLKAASDLGVPPEACIVFEDAEAGVEAALRGNMKCIGVGSPSILHKAHKTISTFEEVSFDSLLALFA